MVTKEVTNQETLFEEWKETCERLKNLSCYFQNDFDRIIEDEYVTVSDIYDGLNQFSVSYEDLMKRLKDLKHYAEDLMESKIKVLKER